MYILEGRVLKIIKQEGSNYTFAVEGELFNENTSTKVSVEYMLGSIKQSVIPIINYARYIFKGEVSTSKSKMFFVNTLELVKYTKPNEIKRFLINATKEYKNEKVTETLATRLVDYYNNETFFEDVFKACEDDSVKVCYKKITDEQVSTLKRITGLYIQHSSVDSSMILTKNQITLLQTKYPETNPYDIIKKIPYDLVVYPEYFSFEFLDKIGLNTYDEFSVERIEAALYWVLESAKTQGHCFLYSHDVYFKLISVLGLYNQKEDDDIKFTIKEKIKYIIEESKKGYGSKVNIATRRENNKVQIYQKNVFTAELSVSDKLKQMSSVQTKIDEELALRIINNNAKKYNFPISDEQKTAILLALKSKVFILTGAAGTGKTTTTKILVETIKEYSQLFEFYDDDLGKLVKNEANIVLCAPTGMAAKKMKDVIGYPANTIHNVFKITPFNDCQYDIDNPIDCTDLIVDEMSMVDLMVFKHIVSSVSKSSRLILIGDPNQLMSIGAGNVLHDLLESGIIPSAKLTKIFRQSEEKNIIRFSHDVLNGRTPKIPNLLYTKNEKEHGYKESNLLEQGYDCVFINEDAVKEKGYKTDSFLVSLIKDKLPKYYPMQPIQMLSPVRKDSEFSTFNISNSMQEAFNPMNPSKKQVKINKYNRDEKIEYFLREGDKVINIKNMDMWTIDEDGNRTQVRINNGEIGFIEEIRINYGGGYLLYVNFNGLIVEYTEKETTYLELAYCVTIHKSQGSEFPIIVICLGKSVPRTMLQRGLIYTAITRGKQLVIIYGSHEALNTAVMNNPKNERNTYLKELLNQTI